MSARSGRDNITNCCDLCNPEKSPKESHHAGQVDRQTMTIRSIERRITCVNREFSSVCAQSVCSLCAESVCLLCAEAPKTTPRADPDADPCLAGSDCRQAGRQADRQTAPGLSTHARRSARMWRHRTATAREGSHTIMAWRRPLGIPPCTPGPPPRSGPLAALLAQRCRRVDRTIQASSSVVQPFESSAKAVRSAWYCRVDRLYCGTTSTVQCPQYTPVLWLLHGTSSPSFHKGRRAEGKAAAEDIENRASSVYWVEI